MLKGKTVVLGVTGGIAAYKIASLASALVKMHADVRVIMTENATNFITPITFETLTGHKTLVDTFDRNFEFKVSHVALADAADVMMIAPATANVMAKLAHGIADDMLTTTALACEAPIIVAPAMNTHMYQKQVTQDNIETLRHYGMEVIAPANGYLACGTTGEGKMPEPETLLSYILKAALREKDLAGKKVLVTAGPTEEALDPVRVLTNHSTGKMGYAIAEEAAYRGAEVWLVSGRCALSCPDFIHRIDIRSAKEMYDAVLSLSDDMDFVIKAAAVADYRPKQVSDQKIKKKENDLTIELERTDDILATLGSKKKEGQILCGFAMETQDLIENGKAKLVKKNVDMIVGNNLKVAGAGFATDTNVVTFITKEGVRELPLLSKEEVAHEIFNELVKRG